MKNDDKISSSNLCVSGCNTTAEELNRDCFCQTFQAAKLAENLALDDTARQVLTQYPQFFSNTSVYISPAHLQHIVSSVQAIERVVALPAYAKKALAQAPAIANFNPGIAGVFMGYDFHLGAEGAKLIEINTNAGGAFLNALLRRANTPCDTAFSGEEIVTDEIPDFMAMFKTEWKLQRGEKKLRTIAIVDESPATQFLYPEFKLAQELFRQHGLDAFIVSPQELQENEHGLFICNGDKKHTIDLIYNRLTDFYLVKPEHQLLQRVYAENRVVLTPNPFHHALYADKRNLCGLSCASTLRDMGALETDIELLQARVPVTQLLTPKNAEDLWAKRRELFFKPAAGFGSRATYRGSKLTRGVWQDIVQKNYVAQALVIPTERAMRLDGKATPLKMDLRAYVYAGKIQLLAARLYQGQTTNFRTLGGGFAPVFVV